MTGATRGIDRRLVACVAASVVVHVVIAFGLDEIPPPDRPPPRSLVEITIETPPPPPPPPPAPTPPPPPEPRPVIHEPPKAPPVRRAAVAPTPTPAKTEAPAIDPTQPGDPTAKPVFGVTMNSTSESPRGALPVGNTLQPQPPGTPAGPPKPLGVAAAHEVTKMPLPQGRCAGKYTDAARTAAIEGVVVLDLVVDEAGKAREIQVAQGLSHGLTEAAIAALRGCRFSPGERDGQAVSVRIRGFKIRFLLQDGG